MRLYEVQYSYRRVVTAVPGRPDGYAYRDNVRQWVLTAGPEAAIALAVAGRPEVVVHQVILRSTDTHTLLIDPRYATARPSQDHPDLPAG